MRHLTLFLAGVTYGLVASCGAAQTGAYATLDELCEALEAKIEEREQPGPEDDEHNDRSLRRVRTACDMLSEIVETEGGEQ